MPYEYPFLFVDEIKSVNNRTISGIYRYDPRLPFYQGHFRDNPVTPGAILTETMAQIGLVAMGIFLTKAEKGIHEAGQLAFTSADVHFYKPVFPEETVTVKGTKDYFRFHKLQCKVEMYNTKDELVCKGTLAGMIKPSL